MTVTDAASRAGAPVSPVVVQLREAVAAVRAAQDAGLLGVDGLADCAELLRLAGATAGVALVELAAVDRHMSYVAAGRASTAGWLGEVLTVDRVAARVGSGWRGG